MEESEYGDDAEGEDDGGSLGSSRAFEEPALPWAEEQEAVGTEPELRGATATTMSKSYADDFDNTDAYSQYGDDEYDAPDSPQDADLQGQGEGVAEESDYGDDAEGEDVEGDDAYRRSRGSSREIAEPSQETASSPQSETRQASRGADIDDGDGDDADAYSDEYGDEDYELPDSPQERMEEPKTSLQKQDTYELDDAADDAHQGDIAPEDDYEDEEYGGASFAQETQDAFHSPAPAEQEPDVGEAVDARTNSPATGEAGILPLPLSLQQEESEAEPLTARAEDPPAREEESRTAQVASTQEQDEDPPLTARAEDTGGSTCPPGRGEEPPPTSSQNGTGIWGDEDLDAAIAAFQSQDFSQASSLAKKATEHLEVVARGELSGTAVPSLSIGIGRRGAAGWRTDSGAPSRETRMAIAAASVQSSFFNLRRHHGTSWHRNQQPATPSSRCGRCLRHEFHCAALRQFLAVLGSKGDEKLDLIAKLCTATAAFAATSSPSASRNHVASSTDLGM